ncbi:MAG: YihY/virulence factor BrkB family protein [Bacteroidales bacterium]|nr:YihY/virulence factor BrkB family protein [Bacteroidales bacterium]
MKLLNFDLKSKIGFINTLKKTWTTFLHSIKFVIKVVLNAINFFNKDKAPVTAAGLAYYAVFSLFPLLLVLIAGGSLFFEKAVAEQQIQEYIDTFFPFSSNFILGNLSSVLELRGTIGIISAVALLWSSTTFFHILVRSINIAWIGSAPRAYFKSRLLGLGIVAVFGFMLILSFFSKTLLNLLSHFEVPIFGSINLYTTVIWKLISDILPLMINFLMFWGLYFVAPNTRVDMKAALFGSIVTTTLWEILSKGFRFSLQNGFLNYQLVYGSLGTVILLMFWLYLSFIVILLGAYLSSSFCTTKIDKLIILN